MDTPEAPVPIYTIGYGNRTFDELINLLKNYNISFLVDIRSQPYSKYKPEFSKDQLERRLGTCGVRYVFMGDVLGGRPDDPTCYTDGKVDYKKLEQKLAYKHGVSRLRTAWEKRLYVVLMCSESKPQECHRSKLIGETLTGSGIEVAHIDEIGNIQTQFDVISRITQGQLSLLDKPVALASSRKRYNPYRLERK